MPVPPETPARLKLQGEEPVEAFVLAVNDLDIVIGTYEAIGEDVASGRLSLEPTFILDALRDRLADFGGDPAGEQLLETLLDLNDVADAPSAVQVPLVDGLPGLSAEQRNVVARAVRDGVQFIWGPPGTGKTGTLAATVQHLVDQGQRVLVLAHANAAVDVAMVRLADRMADHVMLVAGRVLRAGTPSSEEARSNPWINPDEVLRRSVPALVAEQDALIGRRTQIARDLRRSGGDRSTLTAELEVVRSELSAVRKRLTEARNELLTEAVVIGATLSRFAISDLIWNWPADVIIIDEVSMAASPFVVAAATRGPRTLALFGDFRQLPPVARSSTAAAERWLIIDVFTLAGVTERIELGRADARLSVLQTQFRMGSDIATVISKFAYFGLLRTDIGADERAAALAEVGPAPGSQLVIVDTSEWCTPCLVDADPDSYSRFNLPSCLLGVTLAQQLLASGLSGVGLIAAYRAQARLAADLLRDEPRINAATTHRFQGAESDGIILDLVDAFPQAGPSILTGGDPDLATRLFNVGVSRARGKLIVLVDLDFLGNQHPRASPARQLISLMQDRGAAVLGVADLELGDKGVVAWSSSWSEGIASEPVDAISRMDVSVPDDRYMTGQFSGLLHRLSGSGLPITCRVPIATAANLEDSKIDIKLKTLGAGPIALVEGSELGGSAMLIGSQNPRSSAGRIASEHAIRTAWKLLTGEVRG